MLLFVGVLVVGILEGGGELEAEGSGAFDAEAVIEEEGEALEEL
jgi:hypothetical protein